MDRLVKGLDEGVFVKVDKTIKSKSRIEVHLFSTNTSLYRVFSACANRYKSFLIKVSLHSWTLPFIFLNFLAGKRRQIPVKMQAQEAQTKTD